MKHFRSLLNLEQAAALLGMHVGDLLLAFWKAGFPSPLFDREELFDWCETNCPEVTGEAELKATFKRLHAEGQDPQLVDNGHGGQAILVRVYDEESTDEI